MDAENEIEAVAVIADISPEQLEMIAQEAARMEQERQRIYNGLAEEIQDKFAARQSNRSSKESEWIRAAKLIYGSLSSGKGLSSGLRSINDKPDLQETAGNGLPSHNLVRTKCDLAVSQGLSLQFAGGDKNWDLLPTPVTEGGISQKEAEIQAENMELEIEDQLSETNYGIKARKAYESRVYLGTGILKGPLPSREAKLKYEIQQDELGNLITIPRYETSDKPELFWVDPWMFFPDDTVNCIDDASDAIELHPLSKSQLYKLKKNPGFFADAIEDLCKESPSEYKNQTFSEYASLTDSGQEFLKNKYTVLEYHGPITVDQLGAFGIEPSYDPLGDMYFGEVWVCQGRVLRVELEAVSGLFELPYMVCPWVKDPGSIFGFGLPILIEDPQRMAKAASDMLLENASSSSGPQIVINKSFIEPADGDWTFRPQKVWLSTDYTMASIDQAFKQFEVRNTGDKLFPIINFAREIAQEEAGIPMFMAGLQSPQVGSDSATGQAILQQNGTVVADFYAEQWDDAITEKLIRRWYHWNMQFNPRPEIVGDFEPDVRSSTEYRNKQLHIRDIEKISVEAANNPELAKVINMQDLQRVRLSMMHLPTKTIIKSEDQIRQEEEEAKANPPPPDPMMMKAQAELEKVQVEREKLQLEMEKLRFEMTQQQRREEMDHAEKMGALYARQQESQARVLEAASERDIEMMKLAQASEQHRDTLMSQLLKDQFQAQKDKFLAGMDFNVKVRQLANDAAELEYKKTTGKPGI